jgi:hypothetical protein
LTVPKKTKELEPDLKMDRKTYGQMDRWTYGQMDRVEETDSKTKYDRWA